MKRIGTIFLVFTLIIATGMIGSISALGAGEDFNWRQFEGTTIVVNFPVHMAHNQWVELFPEFEKKTGMKIELDQMYYMRMHDKQLLEFSKSVGDYDVAVIVGPMWKTEYVKAGYLTKLGPFIENPQLTFPEWDFDDFIDAFVDVQGKVCLDCKGTDIYLGGGPGTETHLYAVPASSETSVFAYRKDLFEKYALEVPDTWDEVGELAKFFYENVPDVYGLTMRGKVGHQATTCFLHIGDPFGGKIFDENWEIDFTSEESIEALYFMRKMVEYGPPGIPGFSVGAADNAFLQGQAALYFDHDRIASMVRDPEQSKVVGKVGYTITPKKKNRNSETGGFAVSIPANSQNKEAAWLFITWMTSREVERRLAKGGLQLTDRVSILMDPELREMFPVYKVLEQQDMDPNYRPIIAEFHLISSQYFGVASNQVLTGEKSPEEAMQSIVKPVRKIMEEGGYYD